MTQPAFAMIPIALVESDLSDGCIRIYAALRKFGDGGLCTPTNCYPSVATVASMTGRSEATVKRCLRELSSAGWVKVEARFRSDGQQTSNGYHVFQEPLVYAPVTSEPPVEDPTVSAPVTADPPVMAAPPNHRNTSENAPVIFDRPVNGDRGRGSPVNPNPDPSIHINPPAKSTANQRHQPTSLGGERNGKETGEQTIRFVRAFLFDNPTEPKPAETTTVSAAIKAGWTKAALVAQARQGQNDPNVRSPYAWWLAAITGPPPKRPPAPDRPSVHPADCKCAGTGWIDIDPDGDVDRAVAVCDAVEAHVA